MLIFINPPINHINEILVNQLIGIIINSYLFEFPITIIYLTFIIIVVKHQSVYLIVIPLAFILNIIRLLHYSFAL